jgi:hypothetical protein
MFIEYADHLAGQTRHMNEGVLQGRGSVAHRAILLGPALSALLSTWVLTERLRNREGRCSRPWPCGKQDATMWAQRTHLERALYPYCGPVIKLEFTRMCSRSLSKNRRPREFQGLHWRWLGAAETVGVAVGVTIAWVRSDTWHP